ncbi:geranylgeranyl diphosphate synthase type II [Pseudarthrobacter defluvii]|uniref:polyprenyl synthetase family protein n=1 Tax=Pseudarthrobacter defluvii TaxID=410837 RepID=UPI0027843C46|nr:polyprenyl synthetase family protein [Pseudarthrobacter defluvii]MDQ0768019.1 geranylgeranyl diphosphate synthase type II [Pseudarthrobacter defluvii]
MDTGTTLAHTDDGQLVNDVLDGFFTRAKTRASAMHPRYLALWEHLEACTVGGKRFRPRLVMSVYALLGGSDRTAAATVAASFELLHTALIVHDDVVDRDFTRRGVPNLAGTYRSLAADQGSSRDRAEHTGMSAAVIAGDLALSNAYRILTEAETDLATRQRLGDLLDQAVMASAAGELLDVLAPLDPMPQTVDQVLEMSKLKTAVYSFDTPLRAGAVLAGAEQDLVEALGEFGRIIGTAYQVADDLVGAFGDESRTGKSGWGDLREGKRTALISYAAEQPQWIRIKELLSRDLTAREAAEIRDLLVASGARDKTLKLAADLTERALDVLVQPFVPQTLRDGLSPLSRLVTERMGA